VGLLRRSQRPVNRRSRRPLAVPTAGQLARAVAIAGACGLLASCGGEPVLSPPVDPSPRMITSTPEVPAATPLATAVAPQVGGVIWATTTDPATNAPIDPVTSYRPDAARIIAVLHMNALSPGSSVEAIWEYNDTSLDAFTTRLTQDDGGDDQWVAFYIERDSEVEWPVGTYAVTISLDGAEVQQASVEVSKES
jgi:hypothetical protein